MKRVIVYEMKDGSEEIFEIGNNPENEQHERAAAEAEVHSSGTYVVGYRFGWREGEAPTMVTDGNLPRDTAAWEEYNAYKRLFKKEGR